LRGVEGAYKHVMQAFEHLRYYCPELRIGIIAVISGVNYIEIPGLVRWVKEVGFFSGIYCQIIAKPFFVPLDNYWHQSQTHSFLWPKDTAKVNAVLDELIQMKNEGYPLHNLPIQLQVYKTYLADPTKRARNATCYLGDYVINTDPAGNIGLCCFMEPIGNIKKDNINTLWFSEKAVQMKERMHACNLNCHNIVNCFFR
jgi:MoaA/NifB/PqqE/SkfB family radical SAM enzyme